MIVDVIVKNQIIIKTDNAALIKELKSLLDKPNPKYAKMQRMGYSVHNVPPRIVMYQTYANSMSIPRGTGKLLRELASKYKEPFNIIDCRTNNNPIDCHLKDSITPFWYQDEAVKVAIEQQQGVVEAPCGCLVAQTQISIRVKGQKLIRSIEHLYKNFDKSKPYYVRSFNGKRIQYYKIDDVVYSGCKKLWEMTLENGKKIIGTRQHLIKCKAGRERIKYPNQERELEEDRKHLLGTILKTTAESNEDAKSAPWARRYLTEEGWTYLYSSLGLDIMCDDGSGKPTYSKCVNVEMMEYQNHVYDIVCKDPHRNFVANGMVVHNSGKSIMGVMLATTLKQRTMVVVHTSELFKQWQEVLRDFTTGNFSVGMVGCGYKSEGDITIAMVQTLVKQDKEFWDRVRKKYSIIVFDESQHCGAASYIKIMENLQGKYQIGLSATPKRSDGLTFLIHNYLGKIIYKITDNDLITTGRTVSCRVNIVNTDWGYNNTDTSFADQLSAQAKDKKRNELIVDKILYDIDDGKVPMVLTDRTFQAKMIEGILKDHGVKVAKIIGSINNDIRAKIKVDFSKGKTEVLIASKGIAAEGLDVPIISSVHIAFQSFNEKIIKQMIGRGRRTYKDKEFCRVWMYKDNIYHYALNNDMNYSRVDDSTTRWGFNKIRSWFDKQSFQVRETDGYSNDDVL